MYRTLKSELEGDDSFGSNTGEGIFGKKYSWKRIQSSSEFLEQLKTTDIDNFDAVEQDDIEKSQFVFQFYEAAYEKSSYSSGYHEIYTLIDELTIVQLHFFEHAQEYNLGCVMDIVSIDGDPEGESNNGLNLDDDLFKLILSLLFICILLSLIGPFMIPILTIFFEAFWACIKLILRIGAFCFFFPWNIIFRSKEKR